MFEGILEKILQSRLGQYIDGLDRKNLTMGVWSGNILIENASLKTGAFDKFKLPFRIKFGKIARLKATVPWMSLSSSPVEIILDSLMVILVSKPKSEWEIIDMISKNYKKEIINEFAENLLDSLRNGEQDKEHSQGYLERLTAKIIDNIQIKIRNIHIRYEVNDTNPNGEQKGFSLGVRLEQLNIVTTNQDWNVEFVDRTVEENKDKPMHKIVDLSGLSIYSDSSENCFFSQVFQTAEEIGEGFRSLEIKESNDYNYILRPISFKAKIKKSDQISPETPKYWVKLVVEEFSINLKKKELLNLIKIMDYITQYRKFQDSYNRTIKYKFLRPKYGICEKETDETCSTYNHNPNARIWWRYAIDCVVRTIKMKNGTGNLFKLSQVAEEAISKKYMHYYSKVFHKKQEIKDREEGTSGGIIPQEEEETSNVCKELNIIEHNALDSKERHEYNYILTALDATILKEWTSTVVRKHQEKYEETINRRSNSGGIWSMFNWASGGNQEEDKLDPEQADSGKQTAFHISEEELKEINRVVQSTIEEIKEEDTSDGNLMLQLEYECLIGEIHVEDDCDKEVSGVLFKYENCGLKLFKTMSREFDFVTSMKKISADLFCKMSTNHQAIHIPLVRTKDRLLEEQESEENKQEPEDIYEIKIKRNKSGSVVDYEYDFTVKPIYFYYRALLIKIIKSFTTIGTNSSEELKLNAWDKFQNIKENTQNKIKSALLQTTNIVRGSILNPKVILPYTQNNDLKSPAYVICLGDLKVDATRENLNEPLYRYLHSSITGVQFQYFNSLLLWEKFEKDLGRESFKSDDFFTCINKSVFNVIEEIEIHFKIGQRKKEVALTAEKDKHPQFIIEGKVSDIRVNLTSERYNSLINFNKMIEITTKNFAGNIILHEKEDIIKMATKTGTMRKRGDTLEYWDMFYAVLSGSYLYFYKEDSEENDSYDSWIYLKDTVVVFNEDNDEEDSENVFVISNRDTTLHLFVSDQQELKDWIKCIRERVYEIGSINDSFQSQDPVREKRKRKTSLLDIQYNIPEITIFRANLHFDKFEFNLVHDDYSKFLNFKITEMALVNNTVTLGEFSNIDGLPKSVNNKYSNIIEMNLAKLQIYDLKNDMVALETKNPLSMSVNILDKSSNRYRGDKVVIGLKVDIALFNFIPDSIKYMVNFLKRTEYEGGNAILVDSNLKPKHEPRIEASLKSTVKKKLIKSRRRLSLESLDCGDISSQRTDNEEDLVTLGTKNVLKVNISINTVGMTMINPYNMKPFVYMDIKTFRVTYELYQIHHQLQIKVKDVTISADSPIFNTFKVANIDPEWLRDNCGDEDFAFNFDMKIFKEEFMSSNQKISSILRIDFGGLCLHYQQENIFRIKDYFFDKFLDAITGGENNDDSLLITKKWFQQSIISEDNSIDYSSFDLQQDDKFTKIYIRIDNPKIFLVDRPHFKDGFRFDIEEITFENKNSLKKGRWYNYPDKEVRQNKFIIKIKKGVLSHDEDVLSNTFNMNVFIKGLANSPVEDEIPHDELDKSLGLKIKVNDLLQLSMTQTTYGYLFRCLDLNINFNDDQQQEYEFKNFIDLERLHMDEESCISMRLNIYLKYFSLILLNHDRSFMTEIFYNNANISMIDKGMKDIKIIANRFYVLDKPERSTKQVILGPINSRNVVQSSDLMAKKTKKNSCKMEIIIKQCGEKSIVWNIDRVKVFLKIYSIMKMMKFFTEAMPDYDYSVEKPNGYYKSNGELESKDPGSKMTFIINLNKSIYLLTDDPTAERVIVVDGHLNFNFQRENYLKCKDLLKTEYKKLFNKAKVMNSITSMDNFDPQGDIQMPVGSMTVNLLNTCIKISKMSNIKKCKKWLMTPCNLFYSSNSMMEIIREGKYVVNTEQSINFDKTLVKISIQEIFEFNESIDAIMKDLSKFNIENDDQEKNLRGSHYLRQLNKDLEIERRTYAAKEETKMDFIEERAPRKKSRETSIRRRVSDPNHGLENNLINHELLRRRKATRDSGIMDRTGSIANADDNSYQSRLFKVPSKLETDARKEECEQGYNSMDLFFTGLNIITTNERQTTYYPILNLNISEIHFEKHTTTRVSNAQTGTSISCFYYNPTIGEWEHFIENFKFYVNMDSFENKSCMTLKTDRTVNINLSDIAIGNLVLANKEWSKLQEKKKESENDIFCQIEEYQTKNVVKFSLEQNLADTRVTHAGIIKKLETQIMNEQEGQKAPIIINNLTGYSMSYYKILDEEEKKSAFGVDIKEPEKVYQPIRVEFEADHYAIDKLDISKLHCGRHQLTDSYEDEVYFGIYLNNMYKVLTVRTFYTIHNKTIFCYYLRAFNEDGSYYEFTINPGEKLPIENSMFGNKVSLSIANSENWSEMFYPVERLEKLEMGKQKSFIVHDMEYTFLSKEVDKDVNICYNLNLLPPVIVKNSLPFKIVVKVPSRRDREFFILKGEESYFLTYDLVDEFQMDIKIDGFEYTTIKVDPKNAGSELKIKMKDFNGNSLTIFGKIERERAGFEILLYSKVCIKNYTGLDLELFTTYSGIKRRLAGQKSSGRSFTLASKAKKLIVSYLGVSSPKLRTKNIGYKDDFIIKKRDEDTNIESIYNFVYETSLNLVSNSDTSTDLFCKNIKIFPKFVIVNHLKTVLKYKQDGNDSSIRYLHPQQREILHWDNSQFQQMICIKCLEKRENSDINDADTKWNWTKGIPVKNVGILSIQTRCTRDDYRYKIIRVERRLIESTMFIIIGNEDLEHPTYFIENCSRNVSLMCYQEGYKTSVDYIDVGEKIPYGVVDPVNNKNSFIFQFFIGSLKTNPLFMEEVKAEFDLECVDNEEIVKIPTQFCAGRILYAKSYTDGRTKFLKFTDTVDIEPEESEDVEANSLDIKIHELGFSVISQISKVERKEIAYIFMKNIMIEMLNSPKQCSYNFSIGLLQIDNQLNLKILFPVMLRIQNKKEKNRPAIEARIVMRNNAKDIIFVEEASISLCKAELKIDDELLKVLYKFFRDISKYTDPALLNSEIHGKAGKQVMEAKQPRMMSSNQELDVSPTRRRNSFKQANALVKDYDAISGFVTPNNNSFKSDGTGSFMDTSLNLRDDEKWEKIVLKQKSSNIFIKYFRATELSIDVSFIARFRSDIKFTEEQIVRNQNFFSSLGLALSTIENAPIRIQKLELQNAYGSQGDIQYLFSEYYSTSVKKNLVAIIGSTEILGNPVNLVRTVGTGLHDFVHEPINGFRCGVGKGGLGILKGTGSLAKNTAEGAFGSVSNFSSSISKGILILTRDEEFIYKREGELMSEKPKNIVEGVGYGVKRAFKSVEGAIFGLITQPIKGARREGFKGLLKGTWSGFSGVIIKPIAGGLDFISKTADGFKYNVKIFDEKNNDERIRWPRPFYGNDLRLKSYNSIDSFVLFYISKIFKKDFLKYPFTDSIIINDDQKRKIIIFTTQTVVMIELKKKNPNWIIDREEIDHILKFRNGIKIRIIPMLPSKKKPRSRSNLNDEDEEEIYVENKVIEIKEKPDIDLTYTKLTKFCGRTFDQGMLDD